MKNNNLKSMSRSTIMSRAHELARQMSEEKEYNTCLSEGLTQAWSEVQVEHQKKQEAALERKREGWKDRLETWREEMEKDVEVETDVRECQPASNLDVDEKVNSQKSRVLQIEGWEFHMYPHRNGGWTVRWTERPDGLNQMTFSKAKRIMDYIEKAAHLFDEVEELFMMASTAVDPSNSYGTEGIARRAEVDNLETFYYNRYAVTN